MSDTPRSDQQKRIVLDAHNNPVEVVRYNFAAELERENAAMTHAAEAWRQNAMEWSRENAELRSHEYAGELKAARDEVLRLS